MNRNVFHGKWGELRQAYREGQEDQLGSLGPVLNIIVLWNTIYMDAAIQPLRHEGYPVQDEDVEKLSQLGLVGAKLLNATSDFLELDLSKNHSPVKWLP